MTIADAAAQPTTCDTFKLSSSLMTQSIFALFDAFGYVYKQIRFFAMKAHALILEEML